MTTTVMPAGTYFIGDLCYVIESKWDEVCDNLNNDKITLKDGTTYTSFYTEFGDGTYQDQYGNDYDVDSGTIGCVSVESIDDGLDFENCGNVFTFDEPFECSSSSGHLTFGHVIINTSGDDENYYEDDYHEEDWDDLYPDDDQDE